MSLPITVVLQLESFGPSHVRSFRFTHGLGEPWSATVELAATDVDLDLESLLGTEVRVELEGEPLLPVVRGIVQAGRQVDAESTGESTYLLELAPSIALLGLRRSQRIFQHGSVVAFLATLLAEHGIEPRDPQGLGGRLREPHPEHEYAVQWKETDLAFASRLLAEEGITLQLDPRTDGVHLVDDTTSATDLVERRLPVRPDADALRGPDEPPCVRRVGVGRNLAPARLATRDYDHEHPEFVPEARDAAGRHVREIRLEVYEAQVGDYHDESGAQLAGRRRLEALRSRARTVMLETNVASSAGVRLVVEGASRAGVDGELLVVAAETTWTTRGRHTRLECIPSSTPFRSPRRPKPHVHGTHTAFVVTGGEEIDVDELGRVEVQFRWDRRDTYRAGASRRVRVSQPWAGPGFGMTMIPRRGEEVIIAYLDGDPDEPIIVGRVHDGANRDPLKLPDEKTQSIWKSRSVPSSPDVDAYNMIRMEDAAGSEMLELRAQRDSRTETLRNAETVVGVDEKKKVGGSSKTEIAGAYSVQSASTTIGTGPFDVSATTISMDAKGSTKQTSGSNHLVDAASFWVAANDVAQISAGKIVLMAGGSSITITDGGISIHSAGPVDVKGAPIKLNCP